MKRFITILSAVLLAVTIAGCTSTSSDGNPQAKEAAYNAASADTFLNVLAAQGNPNESEVSVEFIEAWEADDTPFEIYQATENIESLGWHNTWLLGVADHDGEWVKVAQWDPVEAGHTYSRSDIDAFKAYCELNENPIDYEAVDEATQQTQTSDPVISMPIDVTKVYENDENGISLSLSASSETDGYMLSFDDGTVTEVVFDSMEMDNGGDEVRVFLDDGFGITMRYCAVYPNQVEIIGNSRGAQEYAGFYRAE